MKSHIKEFEKFNKTKEEMDNLIKLEETESHKPSVLDWILLDSERLLNFILCIMISSTILSISISIILFFIIGIVSAIFALVPLICIIIGITIANSSNKISNSIFNYRKINTSFLVNNRYYSKWFLKFNSDNIDFGGGKEEILKSRSFTLSLPNHYEGHTVYFSESELRKVLKDKIKKRGIDIGDDFKYEKGYQDYFLTYYFIEYKVKEKYNKNEEILNEILYSGYYEVEREKRKHWKNGIVTNRVLPYKSYRKLRKYENHHKRIKEKRNYVESFKNYQKEIGEDND